MNDRSTYKPGSALGATVEKEGDRWTLVLIRDLSHPPARVWRALTDPEHLREWAPFDANKTLGTVGTVQLTTVGTPKPHVTETIVKRADPPRALEYSWGGNDLRWELEPRESGTRLKLWHNIDKGFISMGAAGWHICFDVLERLIAGTPIGRIVGPEAMSFEWPRLNQEYASLFGVSPPAWPPGSKAQQKTDTTHA
jgi:uncharacterized protein YndB with AHSA1/START domain